MVNTVLPGRKKLICANPKVRILGEYSTGTGSGFTVCLTDKSLYVSRGTPNNHLPAQTNYFLCTSLYYRKLDVGLWLFYSPLKSVTLSDWLFYQCQKQTLIEQPSSSSALLLSPTPCRFALSLLCRPLCRLSRHHKAAAISPGNNFMLLENHSHVFICGNNFEEMFGPFKDKEDGSHSE